MLGYWATAPTAHASRAPSGRRPHAPGDAPATRAEAWGKVKADEHAQAQPVPEYILEKGCKKRHVMVAGPRPQATFTFFTPGHAALMSRVLAW